MTSFGAAEIVHNTESNGQKFNSIFKIKGQVYHKVGSLRPMPNKPHKVLQIYFMGGEDVNRVDPKLALANRMNSRCGYNNLNLPEARLTVGDLDTLLNEHNELLKFFKSHIHELQSDNHAIDINPVHLPGQLVIIIIISTP